MLLLWCLSMTQVLHLSSRRNKFLVSLFISIQSIVFCQWQNFTSRFRDVFHKPTTSLLVSLLDFQQLQSTLLLKMLFQAHLRQKMLCSPPFIPFHSLISSGGIVMLLSSTHHLVLSRSSSIPSIYNRSAIQIISFLFLLYLVLTGVLWLSFLF